MGMHIEFLELTETRATFIVSGSSPYFVNALRRTLIADIPKMAIEDVEFHLGPIRDASGKEFESVFPVFDEIVAHRLSLLPIPTDLDIFTFRDRCKCGGEGCPSCRIMYKLNKMGPCTVYSGDLEPLDDPKLAIKDDLIPIIKLTEGQAPLVYATAYLGTSSMHAKWQVCSGVGYRYYPIVEVDQKKCDGNGKCAEKCPRGVLKLDKKKAVVENLQACNLCNTCVEVCEYRAITVKGDETRFIFSFETDGSVPAMRALTYALKLLEERFTEFREKLGEEME
ncbi:MAG: DNA-directed RNA polymerase subunit D [Thermoplasmatota archaeon]